MVRDIVRNTFWGFPQGFPRHLKLGFQRHLKKQKKAGCQAVPKAARGRGTEAAISKSLNSVMQPQWECCRMLQGATGCYRVLQESVGLNSGAFASISAIDAAFITSYEIVQ